MIRFLQKHMWLTKLIERCVNSYTFQFVGLFLVVVVLMAIPNDALAQDTSTLGKNILNEPVVKVILSGVFGIGGFILAVDGLINFEAKNVVTKFAPAAVLFGLAFKWPELGKALKIM